MSLKLTKSRHAQLVHAFGARKREGYPFTVDVTDRERRAFLQAGIGEPSPSDTASMDRAKAKRERKAAKVARINPVCFGA